MTPPLAVANLVGNVGHAYRGQIAVSQSSNAIEHKYRALSSEELASTSSGFDGTASLNATV
ncbi:MAG: hypothetical protein K2W95_08640 [Candidatus Obscuribacterales bacterium]|nr:hypothetical protein [Candidatus Obscuribacterales bacterium]